MAIVSFKSFNFPDWRMRHRDFMAYAEDYEGDNEDFFFQLKCGLGCREKVSFESINFPGHYLVHQGFRVQLKQECDYEDHDLFRQDATFEMVCPNNGTDKKGYMSFRSANYPDHCMRHRDGELWLDEFEDSELFADDSTWKLKMKLKKINIFSHANFEDHAIAIDGDEGFLKPMDGECDDPFEFKIRPGNAWGQGVSFELKHNKGVFLRHAGFRLRCDPYEDDELYLLDSTFVFDDPPEGIGGEGLAVAISSVNYPNNKIRHRNYELWLDEYDGELPEDFSWMITKD